MGVGNCSNWISAKLLLNDFAARWLNWSILWGEILFTGVMVPLFRYTLVEAVSCADEVRAQRNSTAIKGIGLGLIAGFNSIKNSINT